MTAVKTANQAQANQAQATLVFSVNFWR